MGGRIHGLGPRLRARAGDQHHHRCRHHRRSAEQGAGQPLGDRRPRRNAADPSLPHTYDEQLYSALATGAVQVQNDAVECARRRARVKSHRRRGPSAVRRARGSTNSTRSADHRRWATSGTRADRRGGRRSARRGSPRRPALPARRCPTSGRRRAMAPPRVAACSASSVLMPISRTARAMQKLIEVV